MPSADEFLDALPRFAEVGGRAYKPGLERMEELLGMLGSPHRRFRSVHVAGTNGKGSTASLIAAIGTASGLKIGLHTSPHLFHVTERMRIDGRPAPQDWLADAVGRIRPLAARVSPSYFEVTVSLAFQYFAEEAVDLAVVEAGMGGRLDATNVLSSDLSVITSIGLDHTEFLGDTVGAIAREKAGIIKRSRPVVCSAEGEAAAVVEQAADRHAAPFHSVNRECLVKRQSVELEGSRISVESPLRLYDDLFVDLPGRHQVTNALAALRAAELLFEPVQTHPTSVYEGLRRARELSGLRGRLDIIRVDPLIVADVAHNPGGLEAAIAYLRATGSLAGRLEVLLGVMRDKDVPEMARVLASAGAFVRPVEIDSPRALPGQELGEVMSVCGLQVASSCTVREGIRAFLSGAAPSDTLLVTGSHLVVAQLEGVPL